MFCLFLVSFLFTASRPAAALLKKEKIVKNSPPTDVAEIFPYRVFFIVEPSVKDPSSKKSWSEINYKLVNGKETPGPLFENVSGGKVRFLDKDGFVLAADFFLNEDFQGTDFYGTVIVENKRAATIVSADAQPLREGELETLRRERAEKEAQKRREEELLQKVISNSSESPGMGSPSSLESVPETLTENILQAEADSSPAIIQAQTNNAPDAKEGKVVRETNPSSPSLSSGQPQVIILQAAKEVDEEGHQVVESTKIISEPAQEQKQAAGPSQVVKIQPSLPDKKKELLDLGGATNDDIQATLDDMNKRPPTEVQESPSEIPGISSETD